jgi:hypothetical protein
VASEHDYSVIINKPGDRAVDVSAASGLLTAGHSKFSRLLARQPSDGEEMRFAIPSDLANDDIYIGVAPDGTATSASDWDVVRVYCDGNANPKRARLREGIAWDQRGSGW